MRLWEKPITKWLMLVVTSGDPLPHLPKQEQHRTWVVSSWVLSISTDWDTATSPGQSIPKLLRAPHPQLCDALEKRFIETKRAFRAWRKLTELTVISKLRNLSMEMTGRVNTHHQVIVLIKWLFTPRDILYIYAIRARFAWVLQKTKAFIHWGGNQSFSSLNAIMHQWHKHDYF